MIIIRERLGQNIFAFKQATEIRVVVRKILAKDICGVWYFIMKYEDSASVDDAYNRARILALENMVLDGERINYK
jgi:hypothetical protein